MYIIHILHVSQEEFAGKGADRKRQSTQSQEPTPNGNGVKSVANLPDCWDLGLGAWPLRVQSFGRIGTASALTWAVYWTPILITSFSHCTKAFRVSSAALLFRKR